MQLGVFGARPRRHAVVRPPLWNPDRHHRPLTVCVLILLGAARSANRNLHAPAARRATLSVQALAGVRDARRYPGKGAAAQQGLRAPV